MNTAVKNPLDALPDHDELEFDITVDIDKYLHEYSDMAGPALLCLNSCLLNPESPQMKALLELPALKGLIRDLRPHETPYETPIGHSLIEGNPILEDWLDSLERRFFYRYLEAISRIEGTDHEDGEYAQLEDVDIESIVTKRDYRALQNGLGDKATDVTVHIMPMNDDEDIQHIKKAVSAALETLLPYTDQKVAIVHRKPENDPANSTLVEAHRLPGNVEGFIECQFLELEGDDAVVVASALAIHIEDMASALMGGTPRIGWDTTNFQGKTRGALPAMLSPSKTDSVVLASASLKPNS